MKSGRNKEKIIELISNFPVIPGHKDSGCGLKKKAYVESDEID